MEDIAEEGHVAAQIDAESEVPSAPPVTFLKMSLEELTDVLLHSHYVTRP